MAHPGKSLEIVEQAYAHDSSWWQILGTTLSDVHARTTDWSRSGLCLRGVGWTHQCAMPRTSIDLSHVHKPVVEMFAPRSSVLTRPIPMRSQPLHGLCYRDVRRELSIERRGQHLEERATKCRLRGCNLHSTRWQTRFPRAPLTYSLAPHVQLPGGL